ncbi:prepilin peptidase [Maridesulfovibrio bastinii]|uniref:prepilin peptidase n=1 Tax=Maridesulfovibrio bastinii TaxID=47157 RepID=UPI00048563D2|nr:A24 family peptidase [Maridesulfovibrio bastinii]
MNILSANIQVMIIATLIGAITGSFYACAAYRYINGLSLLNPKRSFCPECGYQLKWYDNIPVVSYILLKGKCRNCHEKISMFYPAVELISILWALALMHKFGPGYQFIVYMVLGGIMITAAAIDMKTFILPDMLTIPGAVIAVATMIFMPGGNWREVLWGAAIGSGLFMTLRLLYRGLKGEDGLGLGDVKLMFMIGAMSGPQNLPLVITVAAGSGIIGGLIQLKFFPDDENSRNMVPFGPFLVLGSMLATLYSEAFWLFYLR